MKTITKRFLITILMVFSLVSLTSQAVPASPPGHVYTLSLGQEIGDVENYSDVLDTLENAKPGDTCIFELVGFGGQSYTMATIINAVHHSSCYSIMHVIGNVYSAHAYIAISGDKLVAEKGVVLMFHDVQMGNGGHDDTQDKITRAYFQNMIHEGFKPFFTDSEFKFMFANSLNELYVTGLAMMQRLAVLHRGTGFGLEEGTKMSKIVEGGWAMMIYLPKIEAVKYG